MNLRFSAGPQTPERLLKKFVEIIHAALPETHVYFISIKPSIRRWHLWGEMDKANGLIKGFARKRDLVEYLHIATPMLGEDGTPRAELFVKDGLHLNAAGYQLWTQIIKPRL